MASQLPDWSEKELPAGEPEKLLTDAEHAEHSAPVVEQAASNNEQEYSTEVGAEAAAETGPDKIETARQQVQAAEARETAEAHSITSETTKPKFEDATPEAEPTQHAISKDLKSAAYTRLLGRARKELNPAARAFSRVTHQPVIDKLSQAAAGTIARPSGLIGGGALACLGSMALLFTARHYGFAYNYLAFFWLLLAGFALGILVELALNLRPKH